MNHSKLLEADTVSKTIGGSAISHSAPLRNLGILSWIYLARIILSNISAPIKIRPNMGSTTHNPIKPGSEPKISLKGFTPVALAMLSPILGIK